MIQCRAWVRKMRARFTVRDSARWGKVGVMGGV